MNFTRCSLCLSVMVTCLTYVTSFVLMDPQQKGNSVRAAKERLVYLETLLKGLDKLTDGDVDNTLTSLRNNGLTVPPRKRTQQNVSDIKQQGISNTDGRMYLEKLWADVEKLTDDYDVTNFARDETVPNKKHGGPDADDSQQWFSTTGKAYANVINLEKKDYAILPPATEWCRMMGFRSCGKNRSRR